jgi:hypothetical protein
MSDAQPTRIDREHIDEQPDCPHTAQELTSIADLPSTANAECPVCYDNWFNVNGATETTPLLLPCGHVVCADCFAGIRDQLQGCYYRWCPRPPVNVDGCHACHVSETRRQDLTAPVLPPHHFEMVRCVQVDDNMLEQILDKLNELADVNIFFNVNPFTRAKLIAYMGDQLRAMRGQLHTHEDLAMLLDPTQGSDVDPAEVSRLLHPLRRPFPDSEGVIALQFLPPLTDTEGWITTFLRTVTASWDIELGVVNPVYDLGNDQRGHLDWLPDGSPLWYWPVKRIVEHRFSGAENRDIEYKVEYVRFENPLDHEWRRPAEFSLPAIYRLYNAENGLVFDANWMADNHRPVEAEDVVMEEGTVEHIEYADEHMWDSVSEPDDDNDGDFVP